MYRTLVSLFVLIISVHTGRIRLHVCLCEAFSILVICKSGLHMVVVYQFIIATYAMHLQVYSRYLSLEKPNVCIPAEFPLLKFHCFKPQWQKQTKNNIKNVIKAP